MRLGRHGAMWALAMGLGLGGTGFAQEAPGEAPTVGAPAVEQAPSAPVTYTIDASKTWLYVLVRYDRGTLISGHDHGVRATQLTGTVTWNPDDLASCAVSITAPVAGLRVDTPGLRARLGLEGETPEKDKGKIEENLRGKYQLEADKYPTISYKASRCEDAGSGKVKVVGELTVHGRTKTVATTLDVKAEPSQFTAKGSFGATHADFGMKPFSAALGAVKNDEALKFYLDVVARP